MGVQDEYNKEKIYKKYDKDFNFLLWQKKEWKWLGSAWGMKAFLQKQGFQIWTIIDEESLHDVNNSKKQKEVSEKSTHSIQQQKWVIQESITPHNKKKVINSITTQIIEYLSQTWKDKDKFLTKNKKELIYQLLTKNRFTDKTLAHKALQSIQDARFQLSDNLKISNLRINNIPNDKLDSLMKKFIPKDKTYFPLFKKENKFLWNLFKAFLENLVFCEFLTQLFGHNDWTNAITINNKEYNVYVSSLYGDYTGIDITLHDTTNNDYIALDITRHRGTLSNFIWKKIYNNRNRKRIIFNYSVHNSTVNAFESELLEYLLLPWSIDSKLPFLEKNNSVIRDDISIFMKSYDQHNILSSSDQDRDNNASTDQSHPDHSQHK
jgi:hypothetical protein